MSGVSKEEDRQTHTHIRCVEEVAFFLFLGFYRMNVTSPLSHHLLHQTLVCASVNIFFPMFFP